MKSEKVVFHGTNAEERFDSLEARQANDESKESGNKKAVYATTTARIPLALAILNKTYIGSRFRNFMTVWGDDNGKMIFEFSPNVYELFKSGDPNLFSDGYVYVLDKANFINAEDAGNEWHSEVNQKPLLACRVSKKLADVIFIIGKGDKDNVREYSENKQKDMSNNMQNKTAVIIKGNPVLVTNNEQANVFYKELASFLEELGFIVKFDPGEPFTTPEPADLWIGHSRGSDRLRFAPESTITIGIGVPKSTENNLFPVVNHPDDEMVKRKFSSGKVVEGKENEELDDSNHYILTKDMKTRIAEIIKRGRS